MRKLSALLTGLLIMTSQVFAHADHSTGFSLVAATEESRLAYLIVGMGAIIAVTSIYFMYDILRGQWRGVR